MAHAGASVKRAAARAERMRVTSRMYAWRLRLAAALLAAMALAPDRVGAEELYRWRDRHGREHFGSAPPADAREVRVVEPSGEPSRIQIAPAAAPPAAATAPRAAATAPRAAATAPRAAATAPRAAATAPRAAATAPRAAATAPRAADPRRTLEALERAERQPIGGRTEAQWRERATKLEARIEGLEEDVERAEDALGSAYRLSSAAYYERKLRQARDRLAAAEAELSALEDRARALGVPPGWLR
jgi:hypothetical protein